MIEKKKVAKIIRIATIPPLMVCALLLLLYFIKDDIILSIPTLLLSMLFLMVIPVLAYPLASVIPGYRRQGRDGQRNLAFILSFAGYAAAVVYGLVVSVGKKLLLIYSTYFVSVIILAAFNKLARIRASGHSCSMTGPLILAVYFIGWESLLPCAVLFASIIWASLYLKRHSPKELLLGGASAALAFVLSLHIV